MESCELQGGGAWAGWALSAVAVSLPAALAHEALSAVARRINF